MNATERAPSRRRTLAAVGDHLLTVLAVAGSLCIALVILSWVFNISIMMFRTGSMSPTITTGSIAFVHEIPAIEMEEGDVVTVDRGADILPVTHRVVAIEKVDRASGEVTFVMRGDANDVEDPEPYTATEVRRVMFSVPGAARVVQWFGNPYVLGGLTLGATALVIWAFWPREREADGSQEGTEPRPEEGPDSVPAERPERVTAPPPKATTVRHAAGIPLLAALVLTAPGIDRAETALFASEHLRMQTVGNPVQMQNLTPGQAVTWDVGVWAEAPAPGEIRLGITGRGELSQIHDALQVSVQGCSQQWSGDRCPTGTIELLAAESLDRIAEVEPTQLLATMASDEERWLRVEVVLDDSPGAALAGAEGDVLIHASGAGEDLLVSPDEPPGGGDPPGVSTADAARDGDGLARTGASGVIALLSVGLLLVVLGTALRQAKGRGERR